MFKTPLELKLIELMDRVKSLECADKGKSDTIQKLQFDLECEKRRCELKVEEERNKLRKEMEKSLIESDLKRVEAVAKYETYVSMDTKEERKVLQQMLDKAITALGQKPTVVK